jgi:hypothetical protein
VLHASARRKHGSRVVGRRAAAQRQHGGLIRGGGEQGWLWSVDPNAVATWQRLTWQRLLAQLMQMVSTGVGATQCRASLRHTVVAFSPSVNGRRSMVSVA